MLFNKTETNENDLTALEREKAELSKKMSVLSAKYPTYVILKPVLERLNHGLVNMSGLHNFRDEADIYLDLAFNRAKLGAETMKTPMFSLPKWVYELILMMYAKIH